MNIKELQPLGLKELNDKLDEIRRELIKVNGQISTGTNPKNPGQVKNYKKTIARIHTLLKQKEGKSDKK